MSERTSIHIVGASLAGARAAETLRREGFDGRLVLVGEEPHRPYDRPPLSKQVLTGEWELDRLDLVPDDRWSRLDVEFRSGARATGLDVEGHRLCIDGEWEPYDGLLIATGARPRSLPGTEELGGVHVLRTLDDCLGLRADLDAGPSRVVVVGAGFIGGEVAATAHARGLDVTVIEALPRPLERILGADMGERCARLHLDHGVDLRCGVGVAGLDGTDRVTSVRLDDGSVIEADVVVAGIGVVPNTEWAEGSGLTIDNGIVCDETTLAAPDVVAAGDVARWPNRLFGETMRVEHWDNAVEMGVHAARRLLADDAEADPFTPVPWFWSDQYDRKIQLAGRSRPDDRIEVVHGDVDEGRFVTLYGRDDRVTAVLGWNRPRHVMQVRGLIGQGASWNDALALFADG